MSDSADSPKSPPAQESPPPRKDPAPVLVIGAGIAGLTAAYRLKEAGVTVCVLEAGDRCGGPMASRRVGGHLFELGPNTVPSTAPNLARLIDDLGLERQLSEPVAGRRLVWRRGRLHALPEKPPQLLTCTAISPFARLRLLLEPLVPTRRSSKPETLEQFGRRRLGRGAVAGFLDPFITGVFAGRLDRLGVDALPRLASFERDHGSLFKALKAAQKARASSDGPSGPAPLVSFRGGLGVLPAELVERLGDAVLTGCRATALEKTRDGYRVLYESDGGEKVSKSAGLDASQVILATPAYIAAQLLEPHLDAEPQKFLGGLEHPFVATVGLGFRREQITHDLNAFGLLIASDSRLPPEADILGVLFPSSIFAGRAPEGEVTLTVMVGGARDPAATSLDDEALLARCCAALEILVGLRGEPTAIQLRRWARAIPQYAPGHSAQVAALRQSLAGSGLALAGNYLDGVGVEGAVSSGEDAAKALLAENK